MNFGLQIQWNAEFAKSICYYDSQGKSGHEHWDEIHEDYKTLEENGHLKIS